MTTKAIKKRSLWIALGFLVLVCFAISATPASPSAQSENLEEDMIREKMMETAYRYAFEPWWARAYGDNSHVKRNSKVYTPDRLQHPGLDNSSTVTHDWFGWGDGGNCGVPYFYGGYVPLDEALDDVDPEFRVFNDLIENGYGKDEEGNILYDAGDISPCENCDICWCGRGSTDTGVDCSGFVSQVWNMGSHFLSDDLKNNSLPILFKNLKKGDLLWEDHPGHVMLFNGPVNESWVPSGETWIQVVEAAAYNGKVSLTDYKVVPKSMTDTSETWNGIENIPSNNVTLERVGTYFKEYLNGSEHPCNGPLIRRDISVGVAWYPGSKQITIQPRTYIFPVSVVLILDRSESMAEKIYACPNGICPEISRVEQTSKNQTKMDAAINAAMVFVDLMEPGDKIGIVSFNHEKDPTLVFQLQTIRLVKDGTKEEARGFIDQLKPEGNTSLGAGLNKGHELLTNEFPPRLMVLLSDGRENSDPRVTHALLEDLYSQNIPVLTVALGDNADEALLQHIANTTGGSYLKAASIQELTTAFLQILGRIYREYTVRTASGTVPAGATAEEKVLIDSTIGSMTFVLSWPGSDLDLTLVQPDGTIIDPWFTETNPNMSFTSGETYEFYKVHNPQPGEWTMRIFGNSTPEEGEPYTIAVSAMSAMDATIEFDKTEYYAEDPVKITAKIEDTFVDFSDPLYVLGAAIEVTVEDPFLDTHNFSLYDDGQHGDGGVNDGIYANTFTETSLLGSYNFTVHISGNNNRDGDPFTREYTFSQVFKDPILRFPNTPVLDDFNRRNGKLGAAWSGANSYQIAGEQLNVKGGGPIYWNPGILGPDQQAFVTLTHVDPKSSYQGLLLKVQDSNNKEGNWGKGAIGVFYSARDGKVGIETHVPGQGRKTLAMFDATLQDGDQLGGRAEADGTVRAYVNGVEIGSVNAGTFFVEKGGRIGLWFIASGAVLDDFGGGGQVNLPVIQGSDDDGPEPGSCHPRANDTNVYLGYCMNGTPITSGFRFQNVSIPPGADIQRAHLEFVVDGPYTNELALQIFGEQSTNALTFSDLDQPGNRPLTMASVAWNIPSSNVWRWLDTDRTPDITAIVQEVVNLPGWESGNAMVVITQADPAVSSNTHRRVVAWEGDVKGAPRLVVIYTVEAPTTP